MVTGGAGDVLVAAQDFVEEKQFAEFDFCGRGGSVFKVVGVGYGSGERCVEWGLANTKEHGDFAFKQNRTVVVGVVEPEGFVPIVGPGHKRAHGGPKFEFLKGRAGVEVGPFKNACRFELGDGGRGVLGCSEGGQKEMESQECGGGFHDLLFQMWRVDLPGRFQESDFLMVCGKSGLIYSEGADLTLSKLTMLICSRFCAGRLDFRGTGGTWKFGGTQRR